tara:strand:+ start:2380 stop:2484 length:105 start_codon:yes stop_codon:yes gene_type:complete
MSAEEYLGIRKNEEKTPNRTTHKYAIIVTLLFLE